MSSRFAKVRMWRDEKGKIHYYADTTHDGVITMSNRKKFMDTLEELLATDGKEREYGNSSEIMKNHLQGKKPQPYGRTPSIA